MRFALAGMLALAIGSQADAQLIRRSTRPAYTPAYSQSYYTSPSYATQGLVITAGYSPNAWSNNYVYPSSFGFNSGYSNSGYGNYGYSNYGNRNYGYSNYGNRNYGYRNGYSNYGGSRGYRW